jgi:hypothetical protein
MATYTVRMSTEPGRLADVVPHGRRVCSWCDRDMGPSQTADDTHGCCPECRDKYFPKKH